MADALMSMKNWDKLPYVCAGLAGVATLYIGNNLLRGKKKRIEVPKDTVLLYQIDRSLNAPSLSPFPLKLETYLRMANIPYQNNMDFIISSKGKTPWMSYNGVEVADSQFCIEYLNKERGIDLNKHLSEEQRGIAQAFRRMMEDGLYWCFANQRWVRSGPANQHMADLGAPWFIMFIFKRKTEKMLYGQGTGRHSDEEIDHIMERDLKALSQFLGNKNFLFGDEPCEEDCSMFGLLVQLKYCVPGMIGERLLKGELKNLGDYVERIKNKFWPDWNECLKKESKPRHDLIVSSMFGVL